MRAFIIDEWLVLGEDGWTMERALHNWEAHIAPLLDGSKFTRVIVVFNDPHAFRPVAEVNAARMRSLIRESGVLDAEPEFLFLPEVGDLGVKVLEGGVEEPLVLSMDGLHYVEESYIALA